MIILSEKFYVIPEPSIQDSLCTVPQDTVIYEGLMALRGRLS